MNNFCCLLTAVPLSVVLAGCGLFDSGVEWQGGHYVLLWIDTPENISVSRELGDGNYIGRIDATVYALGWDGRYLVAKQHPKGDKKKVNYFIIDGATDSDYAEPQKVVVGLLTEAEYLVRSSRLKLPKFSKVLESLE
jgi:hypothetical protein